MSNKMVSRIKISHLYIFLGYMSLLALGFVDNLRGALLPEIMQDLALSHRMASLLFLSSSLISFLVGLRIASWLTRFGPMRIFRIGLLAMSLGAGAFIFVSELVGLVIAGVLLGVGFGLSAVLENLLVAEGAPAENRQRWMSGLHLMYALASFLSPVVSAQLLNMSLSWRWVMLTGGILPLVTLLFSFRTPDFKLSSFEKRLTHELDEVLIKPHRSWDRSMLFLAFGLALYVGTEILVSTRIPVYFSELLKMTTVESAKQLELFFLSMFMGRLAFTVFRFSLDLFLQIMILALATLLLLVLGVSYEPRLLALVGLAMGPIYPLIVTLAAEKMQKGLHHFFGLAQALSSFVIVLMNIGFGTAADLMGQQMAMGFGILLMSLSLLFLALFRRAVSHV